MSSSCVEQRAASRWSRNWACHSAKSRQTCYVQRFQLESSDSLVLSISQPKVLVKVVVSSSFRDNKITVAQDERGIRHTISMCVCGYILPSNLESGRENDEKCVSGWLMGPVLRSPCESQLEGRENPSICVLACI